jgi:3-phosphoshikimate 1-carboxyvinyltransferase
MSRPAERTDMRVTVGSSTLAGRVRAPPSKSYTHRAVLAAGYGEGAQIRDPLVSADTRATMRAIEAFGGSVTHEEDADLVDIDGFEAQPDVPADVVDCANSGTTMRLTTAVAALADGLTVLTGDDSLRSRPQKPLLQALEQIGGRAESTRANGQAPLVVGGPVVGGAVAIPGDVSSQFVTALLMLGAVTDAGVNVSLQTPLKSAPYVDVTREVMDDFGVSARETDGGYTVQGGQRYDADVYRVPGDFSSISYLLAAGSLADESTVTISGARPSTQGDQRVVEILDRMGGEVTWDRDDGELRVADASLDGIAVSVADTPDLLPTIAVLGAAASGTTTITDAEHVRYKETDRVSAMADTLSQMGASVEETEDELIIDGDETDLEGATLSGRGDHRIVMALSVAGLAAEGETTVEGAEHVDVSFPGFFDALAELGADVRTI